MIYKHENPACGEKSTVAGFVALFSHVNQVHTTVTVVGGLTAVIYKVGFSSTITAVHFDSYELIGNRVWEGHIHKEIGKDT